MSTLANIFMSHEGYLIDKWEQYLGIYESELASLIAAGEPISLLEIGVQNGGSLQIWKKYLPEGSRLVGIDINPDCSKLQLDENTSVHIADASSKEALDAVLGDMMFDVIIDDGSHQSPDVIGTYKALFSRVRGGGKYIVEDLHTSYWAEYGGAFRGETSSIEFFKGLVDGLNCDHFRETDAAPRAELDHLRDFGRTVSRITFYDSVAVIELMNVPRDATYRQMFSGGETRVMPLSTLFFVGHRPSADTRLMGRTAARHVDQMLLGRIEELTAAALAEASKPPPEPVRVEVRVEVPVADPAVVDENRLLRAELAALRSSTSWRLTAPVRGLAGLFNKT